MVRVMELFGGTSPPAGAAAYLAIAGYQCTPLRPDTLHLAASIYGIA